ncbi:tRNA pseudouridine(38-40) synthase TruA [Carboxylicivirga marina]|uniref:tRNA pseudouridine synthase A n=1 Tax=Carboxylicivirga marina TaxID=2800988 RepID=A0ABS1HHT7_9BACT|nr:tRNA pseudouridine(38-40) synthase TruA [Carboxylicivirga marina]MBK3516838.1 tRNA pseudouridine(38-40) synthase TruA [Carboxylicivirga marina]
MHRYFIELAYNGASFHGWQIQPNAISVQEVLNEALNKALRQDVKVVGCGRTDTGVHASYFVAHFDSAVEIENTNKLVHKLNRIVGDGVVVYSAQKVSEESHSRFHAIARTYHYYLRNEKNPFVVDFSYRPFYQFDVDKMNEAARILFEFNDFTSFSRLHTDVKTNNCKVVQAEWKQVGDGVVFVIKADRFLRNMVRAIVGTLLEVGRGKITVEQFKEVIKKKDRGSAGTSVPGKALFLVDVEYPDNVFKPTAKRFPPFK